MSLKQPKPLIRVFTVVMQRWGSSENHSYISSINTSLKAALKEGIQHMEYRGGKYEPLIEMRYVDSNLPDCTICRDGDEARFILEQISPKRNKRNESQAKN